VATKRELEELLREERARSQRLEKQVERLQREVERSNEKLDELQVQIRDLVRKLNEALRATKRQATPFARGKRKQHRRKPGRKPGHPGASQSTPDHVDEEIFEPLKSCPCCGGRVHDVVDHEQFVVDLPKIEAHVKRIVTQSGHCGRCSKRVRSAHPDQVSSAAGAARVALGPNALGLAADLKHRYGMAYRDVAELLGTYFGIRITHGALVQSSVRLARLGKQTYSALIESARASPVVHTDDTGWRIDGDSAWLWVFATAEMTLYRIDRSRGAGVVEEVLGADFEGCLVSDGLPALDSLDMWRAQCLGHLLVRCSELIATPGAVGVWYPIAIMRALQHVIALRKRREELAASTYARYCRDIERRIDRLLSGTSSIPDYERLRRHMAKHRDQLLVCLYEPDVEPTNNLAERELRGAVVIRKLGGCNRSEQHADAHAVIASVAQTAHRQGATMTDFVTRWLRPDARTSAN
jgi:transposase